MELSFLASGLSSFQQLIAHSSGAWAQLSGWSQGPGLVLASGGTEAPKTALITNHAVVFGILMVILGLVFWTSKQERFKTFYKFVPMLLLCYFLPSLLSLFGIVDPNDKTLYTMCKNFLLPTTLVYLTMCIDLREILKLGPKALIMFLTGTVGVVIGGPIAILIVGSFAPDLVGGEPGLEKWRGYSTVAGSWIGGGANQTAMKELYLPVTKTDADSSESAKVKQDNESATGAAGGSTTTMANQRRDKQAGEIFSVMIAVDVIVAEVWMAFLILGVGYAARIDKFFGADSSAVDRLREKMEAYSKANDRIPTATDLMVICGIGFGVTAVCHLLGGVLAPCFDQFAWAKRMSLNNGFFWLIVLATTFGVLLSFTPLKRYEGAGASKIGTVMIFILVGVIGLSMDVSALVRNPGLFLVGGIWMLIHVVLLVVVGAIIRAPYFMLAVGSKANIGGAASAPVVAGAFHPSLAPVGVLLAVLGYALGTYGAWICTELMRASAPDAFGGLVRECIRVHSGG